MSHGLPVRPLTDGITNFDGTIAPADTTETAQAAVLTIAADTFRAGDRLQVKATDRVTVTGTGTVTLRLRLRAVGGAANSGLVLAATPAVTPSTNDDVTLLADIGFETIGATPECHGYGQTVGDSASYSSYSPIVDGAPPSTAAGLELIVTAQWGTAGGTTRLVELAATISRK